MTSLDNYSLDDRYANDEGRVFLTGIQALARVPMEQLRIDAARGLNTAVFLSGYQGSPLGGFDQEMARAVKRVPDLDIVCKPGVNEELAATAVMGSQVAPTLEGSRYDGVIGYWYGKAPGIDRASDALRHAVYAGSHPLGGAVALVGDDPACKSSTLPSSSDLTMMNLKMPVLYPGDVQDVLDLGRHAVALARFSGLWTGFKIVTAVADGSGTVDLSLDRITPVIPDDTIDGNPRSFRPSANLIAPFTNERERDINEAGLVLARRYSEANNLNRVVSDPRSPWLGLVATGYTYREVLQALRRLGFDGLDALADAGVRVLRLDMPFPLAPEPIRRFARGLQTVMVIEEKGPSLEWMIKDVLYDMVDRPAIVTTDGEGRPLFPRHGFLTADQMVGGLRSVMATRLGDRLAPEPPKPREKVLIPLSTQRSPYFCSGCPHNWGTKVPEDTLVGAGIGCSGMALLMDGDTVGDITGITAMGAEGAQWIGMEPFLDDDHYIQNLGDGTFFHSGQLAIQAAIAAGAHMTYKLLYNGTVAMTGGQDPEGQVGVPEIVRIALAHGVTDAIITTDDVKAYDGVDLPSGRDGKPVRVWDRTRIVEAQRYLAALPGVTLLVHDQACAAQTRRLRKRGLVATPGFRVAVNHRICEACGDCGEVSNCLSVHSIDTDLGPKTLIDQTTCNLDFSCMEGDCPSFMTVSVDESKGRSSSSKRRLGLKRSAGDQWDLPEPIAALADSDAFNVRLAGIGGTGVVTVAQILATAAMLDGWNVRGLDQTGLSQKAGPVVSDIRLDRRQASDSNLLGQGEADLVVGFDLIVAASDRTLVAAEQDRTVFVASASPTPTGEMIGRPDVEYPAQGDLEKRVAEFSRPELNRYVDA
ncbi:MAG: indolepyruvate ferredoxin oxidoreductase family protein, partial [Acidimicrobiia bacterium]|nr:indolepyruvate ferredoxin oxidoreductase family protein [Acidimicrobiia bacterium]